MTIPFISSLHKDQKSSSSWLFPAEGFVC